MDLKNLINSIKYSENNSIIFNIDGIILYNDFLLTKPAEIFYYLLTKGYKIYIITSRIGYDSNINKTINQFKKRGIIGYEKIYFMKEGEDPILSKEDARKDIINSGMKIIMSIGNDKGDHGKYSGIGIKVINNGEDFIKIK